MSLVLPNYYGLDIEKATKVLKADYYLGTFTVKGNYKPIAMFYSANPDKSKNHKHYPGLFIQDGQLMVTGFDLKDIKQDLRQYGLHCKSCNDIIYSVNRHDYRSCSCGKCCIDGGRDYVKRVGSPKDYELGVVDFVNHEFYVKDYEEISFGKPDLKIKGLRPLQKNSFRRRQTKQAKLKS